MPRYRSAEDRRGRARSRLRRCSLQGDGVWLCLEWARSTASARAAIGEGAVGFGGIEEGDAALDGRAQKGDYLVLFRKRLVGKAHSHASEAKSRDFKIAFPELARLH